MSKFDAKRSGRFWLIVGLLAGLAFPGLADSPKPQVGHEAPDFTLPALVGQRSADGSFQYLLQVPSDGGGVKLSNLRGQPVLLAIWSFVCAPCLRQLAVLEEFQQAYGDLIQVLGLSGDPESDLRRFLTEQFPNLEFKDKFGAPIRGLTFPIPLDINKEVLLTYRPTRMPPLFFIDPEGIIREIGLGFVRTVSLAEIIEIFAAKVFQVRDPFLPLGPGLLQRLKVTAQGGKAGALIARAELFDLDGDTQPEGADLTVNLAQGGQTVQREIQLALWGGELRGALPEEILVRVLGTDPLEGPELFIDIPDIDRRIVRSIQLQLNDADNNPELVILDENQDGRVDAIRLDFDSDGKVDLQFP